MNTRSATSSDAKQDRCEDKDRQPLQKKAAFACASEKPTTESESQEDDWSTPAAETWLRDRSHTT
jgi:hypothetical protein